MSTLILVRHAKSDWADADLTDHDRPLNDRGRRDAPVMADRVATSGVSVDTIVTSTALRARTTAGIFGERLGLAPRLESGLYLAPGAALLSAARDDGAASVMIVAHDPGLTDLAYDLSDGGIGHMPTCAVAIFTWETDNWDVATSLPPTSWSFHTPRD